MQNLIYVFLKVNVDTFSFYNNFLPNLTVACIGELLMLAINSILHNEGKSLVLALFCFAFLEIARAQLSADVTVVAVRGSLKQPAPSDGLVPDPTVTSVLPFEPKPAVGDPAFITARISNTGTVPIPSVEVSFFRLREN